MAPGCGHAWVDGNADCWECERAEPAKAAECRRRTEGGAAATESDDVPGWYESLLILLRAESLRLHGVKLERNPRRFEIPPCFGYFRQEFGQLAKCAACHENWRQACHDRWAEMQDGGEEEKKKVKRQNEKGKNEDGKQMEPCNANAAEQETADGEDLAGDGPGVPAGPGGQAGGEGEDGVSVSG